MVSGQSEQHIEQLRELDGAVNVDNLEAGGSLLCDLARRRHFDTRAGAEWVGWGAFVVEKRLQNAVQSREVDQAVLHFHSTKRVLGRLNDFGHDARKPRRLQNDGVVFQHEQFADAAKHTACKRGVRFAEATEFTLLQFQVQLLQRRKPARSRALPLAPAHA